MSRFGEFSDRALELAERAGGKLQISGSQAGKLLQTGAALGVARTGAKAAAKFVRRNPVVAVAAAAGIGVLAFAAYRKRKRAQMQGSTEGWPKRVDARRVDGTGKPGKPTAAGEARAEPPVGEA
ncbi:hypothetical protein GCM10027084_27950 [Pseudoxanthomonas sangjuensis]|uniref:hypothetical protein n=1 Tax=Pseudoxanthomonas sangjuensis TaxID=1503750 RepID=UPI001B872302